MTAILAITPTLIATDVEACAQFWEGCGFARLRQEKHGDGLGFVLMQGHGLNLRYRSVEHLLSDGVPKAPRTHGGGSHLFVEVDDLAWAARMVDDAFVAMPPRDTAEGMRELAVLDPGGNVITLAERLPRAADGPDARSMAHYR